MLTTSNNTGKWGRTDANIVNMKNLLAALMLMTAMIVLGCASFPGDMTGTYAAANGEFVRIETDGGLYWSPPSETSDELTFVGRVPKKTEPDVPAYLEVSSNSRLLYTGDLPPSLGPVAT